MSEEITQVRQGDLLFTKIEKFDNSPMNRVSFEAQNGRYVLAEGEKTGHVHAIPEAAIEDFFRARQDSLVIVVGEDTEVTHDEHDPVPLGEGNWLMSRQQEFIPPKENKMRSPSRRNVLD